MMLGLNPSAKIICISYSDSLARKFSRDRRMCIESKWFRRAYSKARIDLKKNTETLIETMAGGSIFATSVGGTLTGMGADFVIIDDPIKAGDAMSEAERTAVNRWFCETVPTRLNDKKTGVIIIAMQRVHQDDLIGHVGGLDDWEELCLPAITQKDRVLKHRDGRTEIWKAGTPLHPEREDLETLARVRRMIGSRAFQAQYLQDPTPAEGDMIKLAWFGRYDHVPARGQLEKLVQSWDVAVGATAQSDYSVCTTWAVTASSYYLVGVSCFRSDFPTLKRRVVELAELHGPDAILVEQAGGGLQLLQTLSVETRLPTIGIVPKGDKEARAARASGLIEAGRVLLPDEAPWLAAFESEVGGFPNARHDDQVDSMTQFLNWAPEAKPPEFNLNMYGFNFSSPRRVGFPD
jgi:predicted phage terminase large subunit-like protein